MTTESERTRRAFLRNVAVAGGGLWLGGCAAGRKTDHAAAHDEKHEEMYDEHGGEEEVSPAEDLMREHGVLKRVLLVYGEAVRRLEGSEELPPAVLADAAGIIREFIEDYHEKLEEEHLFPRFRRAHTLVDLVDVLTKQHAGGRRLTEVTLSLCTPAVIRDPDGRRLLADSLRDFIRMYEPHEAREDTVLFPALRKVVSANEYDALGEDFEAKEHELFGEDGFEKMVERVARIEKELGIYDLAQFTPKI